MHLLFLIVEQQDEALIKRIAHKCARDRAAFVSRGTQVAEFNEHGCCEETLPRSHV
jgi:hypothetical protein